MLASSAFDPQEALVCTMVLVAAADGGMTDREVGAMTTMVKTLPISATSRRNAWPSRPTPPYGCSMRRTG